MRFSARFRMSRRRYPCVIAFVGFVGALLFVASGDIPTATGQPPKALVIPPAPQAPTLTSPVEPRREAGRDGRTHAHRHQPRRSRRRPAQLPRQGDDSDRQQERHRRREAAREGRSAGRLPRSGCTRFASRRSTASRTSGRSSSMSCPWSRKPTRTARRTRRRPCRCRRSSTGRTDAEASDFFKVKVERRADADVRSARAADRFAARPDRRAARREDEARTGRSLRRRHAGAAVRLPAHAHVQGGRRVPGRGSRHDLPRRRRTSSTGCGSATSPARRPRSRSPSSAARPRRSGSPVRAPRTFPP